MGLLKSLLVILLGQIEEACCWAFQPTWWLESSGTLPVLLSPAPEHQSLPKRLYHCLVMLCTPSWCPPNSEHSDCAYSITVHREENFRLLEILGSKRLNGIILATQTRHPDKNHPCFIFFLVSYHMVMATLIVAFREVQHTDNIPQSLAGTFFVKQWHNCVWVMQLTACH